MNKRTAWLLATAFVVAAAFVGLSPLRAWWSDDAGNRALLRGNDRQAVALFEAGLSYEPNWSMLHEDLGRALLPGDPARALDEFDRASCGSACLAEAGDALAAMGRRGQAIDRYVQARAVERLAGIAMQLAAAKRYEAALVIESELLSRLHGDFADRSELAATYAQIGKLEIAAAQTKEKSEAQHVARGLAALARATSLAPLNEDYLLSDGFAEMRFGSKARAQRIFEHLLSIDPSRQEAQRALLALRNASSQPTALP